MSNITPQIQNLINQNEEPMDIGESSNAQTTENRLNSLRAFPLQTTLGHHLSLPYKSLVVDNDKPPPMEPNLPSSLNINPPVINVPNPLSQHTFITTTPLTEAKAQKSKQKRKSNESVTKKRNVKSAKVDETSTTFRAPSPMKIDSTYRLPNTPPNAAIPKGYIRDSSSNPNFVNPPNQNTTITLTGNESSSGSTVIVGGSNISINNSNLEESSGDTPTLNLNYEPVINITNNFTTQTQAHKDPFLTTLSTFISNSKQLDNKAELQANLEKRQQEIQRKQEQFKDITEKLIQMVSTIGTFDDYLLYLIQSIPEDRLKKKLFLNVT